MDDNEQPVTRLGPDSGGRVPGDQGVRVYTWEWGPEEGRRPGLPWIGIFLLVFGGLLLVQQLFPQARALGSLVFVAIGLAFLVKWAIDRGTGNRGERTSQTGPAYRSGTSLDQHGAPPLRTGWSGSIS